MEGGGGTPSITENIHEMIAIGKELFNNKPELYKEKLQKQIRDTIHIYIPTATDQEKEDMFFRSIYDYWVYGNNITEEFMYKFYEKGHEEKSKWITCRNRFPYISHLNTHADHGYFNNKYNIYKELEEFYKRDMILIHGEEDYPVFCDFASKHPEFVIKPTDWTLTQGVHKGRVADHGDLRSTFDALLKEKDEIAVKFRWNQRERDAAGTMVLEEVMDQDPEIGRIHTPSINGVRVTTINLDGNVHIYYPWFKIGIGGGFITGEGEECPFAGIDARTGVVDTVGMTEHLVRYTYHPDSGVKIPGFAIPKWDELSEMMVTIARHFPDMRYIGWDMALTKKGWCVMEANFTGEMLWQLLYGKGMKADLEGLIGWKPDTDFWWQDKHGAF